MIHNKILSDDEPQKGTDPIPEIVSPKVADKPLIKAALD